MTIDMDNQANLRAPKGRGIASIILGVSCVILVLALIATASLLGLIFNIGILVAFVTLAFIGLWLNVQ